MKVLVVGGTGMIGGEIALHLRDQGHDVTIAARTPPAATTALPSFPFIRGSYLDGDFSAAQLAGFEGMVFAAGNDMRHVPEGADSAAHYARANTEGVPRFLAHARDAGIRSVAYIGSFYSQATPHLIDVNPYVRSRHDAEEGARALATRDFRISSLGAPIVVGSIPGLAVSFFDFYIRFALGELGLPAAAPPGGSNFISTLSLAEAAEGALLRGEPGKAYLVGDENMTYRDYMQLFFDAVGNPTQVETVDADNPLMPDATLFAGRGNTIRYEPDPLETKLLGYRRNDIRRAVEELVAQYRARNPGTRVAGSA